MHFWLITFELRTVKVMSLIANVLRLWVPALTRRTYDKSVFYHFFIFYSFLVHFSHPSIRFLFLLLQFRLFLTSKDLFRRISSLALLFFLCKENRFPYIYIYIYVALYLSTNTKKNCYTWLRNIEIILICY